MGAMYKFLNMNEFKGAGQMAPEDAQPEASILSRSWSFASIFRRHFEKSDPLNYGGNGQTYAKQQI
jgi:hypothetical protein